jgi:serine/threonine-protein kinase
MTPDQTFCGNCGHRKESDSWVGQVVDNRYRVLTRIGGGGMGEVYRVEHVRMGKIAAMKIVHGVLARNKEARARFKREAQAISRLNHYHTVQVFDFGYHKDALYLVMEYVKGEDLGSILKRDGPFRFGRVATVAIQVCGALSEAHDQGVIHRDIKPENLLLTRTKDDQDFVKVVDFGLATIAAKHGGLDDADITAQGSIIGTPYYMAPEQIRGEEAKPPTDIYSLGGVMYKLVTGEPPYTAASPMVVLTKCLTEDLVPPRKRRPDLNIPAPAEEVIMKAMAKDAAKRYRSADEMAREVGDCLESLSESQFRLPSGQLPPEVEEGRRFTDRPETIGSSLQMKREDFDAFEKGFRLRRIVQGIVLPLALAALAVGGSYWFWWHGKRPKPAKPLTVEKEPNHTTDKANLIGNGMAIKGTIGRRLSDTESDADVFGFTLPRGSWSVSAKLWPQRNMDLSMRLFKQVGNQTEEVASSQLTGESGPEALTSVPAGPGKYYVVISEVVGKKGPKEGLSDQYKLMVTWRPLTGTDEQEPNDVAENAQRVPATGRITGVGSCPEDMDYYQAEVPAEVRDKGGTLNAHLEGGKNALRLACLVVTEPAAGPDPVHVARYINVFQTGRPECTAVALPPGVRSVVYAVSRKPEGLKRCNASAVPEDLLAAYTLNFQISGPGDAAQPGRPTRRAPPVPRRGAKGSGAKGSGAKGTGAKGSGARGSGAKGSGSAGKKASGPSR